MKSTGIIRNMDELGRLVIPKELRRTFSINEGDPLEIFTNGEKIVIQKYKPETEKNEVVNELQEFIEHSVNEDLIELLNRSIKLIK